MIPIRLKAGRERSLVQRHPWVFSGALQEVPQGLGDGDVVQLMSASGEKLAIGQYYSGTIAVRILTFEDEPIDSSFWVKRLKAASGLRGQLGFSGEGDTTCYRLVHGEGDQLPGLIIDRYGPAAVVHYHSVGMWRVRSELLQALDALNLGLTTVFERRVFEDDPKGGFHIGEATGGVVLENGMKFEIDWVSGQKTGFFLDQRDNRDLVRRSARGRRVLNAFSYTGGFSVAALYGGAQYVDTVDSSKSALQLAERNIALNFQAADHACIDADCMKLLSKFSRPYDLVVLDPPAFAKHRRHLEDACKGYRRVNRMAMEQIESGGLLFTFSCSQAVDRELFQKLIFEAALQAKRDVQILARLSQPKDHPVSVFHPEGEYLKGFMLAVS